MILFMILHIPGLNIISFILKILKANKAIIVPLIYLPKRTAFPDWQTKRPLLDNYYDYKKGQQ